MSLLIKAGALLAAGLAFVAIFAALLVSMAGEDPAAATCAPTPPPPGEGSPSQLEDLTDVQLGNADLIIDVGEQLAVPSRGWLVAISTTLQESSIRNLANDGSSPELTAEQAAVTAESLSYPNDGIGSDHDSVNAFQQRWISGWGVIAELMDRTYAAEAFYGALLEVDGWESMPVAEAAQAVQRSAFPDAYAKWEELAAEIIEALAGTDLPDGDCPSVPGPGGDLAVPPGGWTRPTAGVITSGFGPRWGSTHEGVDIAGPRGTPVYAAAAGVVTAAECTSEYCDRDGGLGVGGYGNKVDIDHGGGESTRYGHLTSYTVAAGQPVEAGQVIGYQGSTGNSTGVHLHFETRVDGVAVDPEPFMLARGVDLAVDLVTAP